MNQAPLPSALILAAGYATRMGGQPKALCPVAGITALERAVTAFQTAGITDIVVVTGHGHEAVGRVAEALGARPVVNGLFADGMFSSVVCGISALGPEVPAVCITPVDAALLLPRTITALVTFWQQNPSCISLPSFLTCTGHPALVPRHHFPPLVAWKGNHGLRGYFASLLPDTSDASATPNTSRTFTAPVTPDTSNTSDTSAAPGIQRTPDISHTPDLYQRLRQHRNPKNPDFLATKPYSLPLRLVPMPDAGIVSDIDTPAELQAAEDLIALTHNRTFPTIAEAWHITAHADISTEKKAHSKAVALGSLRLALALADKGVPVSPFSVVTAGLLHDMLRRKKDHAKHAYTALLALEWEETAFITGSHTSLPPMVLAAIGIDLRDTRFFSPPALPPAYDRTKETALVYNTLCVYLADKHTIDSCFFPIADRFAPIKGMYSHNPEALKGILNRQNITEAVAGHVEQKLGVPLLSILKTPAFSSYEREVENVCSLFSEP